MHVLGIDVGGTKVEIASVVDGRALAPRQRPTPVDDTDKLLELATELKQNVDRTGVNILSLDVVKRAQEIENVGAFGPGNLTVLRSAKCFEYNFVGIRGHLVLSSCAAMTTLVTVARRFATSTKRDAPNFVCEANCVNRSRMFGRRLR